MRVLFSFILIIGLCLNASAQRHACSTVHDEAFMKRLEQNVRNTNTTVEKGFVSRFVPIAIHVVANTDGSTAMKKAEIYDKFCKLSERFQDADMVFYIDEINYIYNSTANLRPRASTSISLFNDNRNNGAVNIYLVSETRDAQGNETGSAGYYNGQNDFVVMLKREYGGTNFTLEHEIGHFFSLAHTHYGWEGDISQNEVPNGYNPEVHGDTVTIEYIEGSTQVAGSRALVELVDMSNCTTAGDKICDTPPDYGFGQACGCCTMIYDVWDKNGDKIEPMMDNIMSYSQGCSPFIFSAEQSLVMQTDYDTDRRSYLRNGPINEYTPIESAPVILSPVDGQTFDNFNGALLEWEPVEHADYYMIEISGTQQLEYETTDTEIYITDLRPNGTYLLDVKAVNEFGTNCIPTTKIFFVTGTGSTSVNELSFVQDLNVYPNPASKNQDIEISFESDKNIPATVSLIGLDGALMWKSNNNLNSGINKFRVPTTNFASGLYLLEINTKEGVIVEKVIIE